MLKNLLRVSGVQHCSGVNGQGLRCVVWFQGCKHKCKGCQNPDSWVFAGGRELTAEVLLQEASLNLMEDGLTLSGGDPFQQENLPELVRFLDLFHAKFPTKTIWAYTGYTFERLLLDPMFREILARINTLVDGPYEQEKKTDKLPYRGSSNQRIIDVPKLSDIPCNVTALSDSFFTKWTIV